MTINEEHDAFKHNGEKNYPYESGKLQAFLLELARRVDFEDSDGPAQEYVEKLKNRYIL